MCLPVGDSTVDMHVTTTNDRGCMQEYFVGREEMELRRGGGGFAPHDEVGECIEPSKETGYTGLLIDMPLRLRHISKDFVYSLFEQ